MNENEKNRKPYAPPALVEYGSIADLTRNFSTNGPVPDGGATILTRSGGGG